ncbi:MAG: flagellar basal body P-ring protein FlgI [Sedimentisphaerales bacterium]|nr:flagellar basal body P-ring protein FlgI [Sedimentisphaerales bacterium]MBN2843108.1 flagellar basal body P-ring protein FlgI [Sedimentisphaerales bacterium]
MVSRVTILLSLLIAAISGCKTTPESAKPQELSLKYGDTIRSVCDLAGYEGIRVSGYSLVWGLKGSGSAECPPDIRNVLVKHIKVLKASGKKYLSEKYARMTAEQLINSPDTAVVRVVGTVPAGAPKGTVFDVTVSIPFATQTTSLEGGMLLPTDLRRVVSGIPGSKVAIAGGPVYIDPLPIYRDGKAEKADPRFGVVLGGGRSDYDRKIRLVLFEPDSRTAKVVEDRINTRFPVNAGPKVAIAEDRESIMINVPRVWQRDYNYFIKIVLKLYLNSDASYQEKALQELAQRASDPSADFEDITLSWEAIGKGALPYLKKICEEESQAKAYYAARTVLNMGDLSVIKTMSNIARSETHPCRYKAASSLGVVADDPMASWTLAGLLNSSDDTMRLLAYDALRKGGHIYVQSQKLMSGYCLDVVKSSADNTICAWAALEPRMVLMGEDMGVADDLFYQNESSGVLINSPAGESIITITRQLPGGSKFVKILCKPRVEDLIRALGGPLKDGEGAGLSFGQTIAIIYDLCERGFIKSSFKMKRLNDNLENNPVNTVR